jgi:hypothetical protein
MVPLLFWLLHAPQTLPPDKDFLRVPDFPMGCAKSTPVGAVDNVATTLPRGTEGAALELTPLPRQPHDAEPQPKRKKKKLVKKIKQKRSNEAAVPALPVLPPAAAEDRLLDDVRRASDQPTPPDAPVSTPNPLAIPSMTDLDVSAEPPDVTDTRTYSMQSEQRTVSSEHRADESTAGSDHKWADVLDEPMEPAPALSSMTLADPDGM